MNDNTVDTIKNLPIQEDIDPTQHPDYIEGMKIAQEIVRKQVFGRCRTKKNRGAQAGAFGKAKIKRSAK